MSAVLSDLPPVGLIEGLPIEAYHRGPGISKSGLDCIDHSPALYFARYLDPERPPEKERAGQLEGSLAHCAVLEPEALDLRYAARNFDGRTSAGKQEAAQIAEARMTPISMGQRNVALAQAASMRSLPDFGEALLDERSRAEVSAFWIDQDTGLLCRCRPDLVQHVEAGVILWDVKTFASADPDEFARQVARKRYHTQAAYYSDGFALASGLAVFAFVFVVVETEYPYLASAVMLDAASIAEGRMAYRRNLDLYAQCIASGQWPGYGDDVKIVSMPPWAFTEV